MVMNEVKSFEMTLPELRKVVEALDMLEWECRVTLRPDPNVKEILKRLSTEEKKWVKENGESTKD